MTVDFWGGEHTDKEDIEKSNILNLISQRLLPKGTLNIMKEKILAYLICYHSKRVENCSIPHQVAIPYSWNKISCWWLWPSHWPVIRVPWVADGILIWIAARIQASEIQASRIQASEIQALRKNVWKLHYNRQYHKIHRLCLDYHLGMHSLQNRLEIIQNLRLLLPIIFLLKSHWESVIPLLGAEWVQ